MMVCYQHFPLNFLIKSLSSDQSHILESTVAHKTRKISRFNPWFNDNRCLPKLNVKSSNWKAAGPARFWSDPKQSRPRLTLSLRWAAMPPGGRDRRPRGSVSSHPRRARSGPSEWPLSARSGIRPGPPGGTDRSWRRPTLQLTPGSLPLRLWRVYPGPFRVRQLPDPGRGLSREQGSRDRHRAGWTVTRRRAMGGANVGVGRSWKFRVHPK